MLKLNKILNIFILACVLTLSSIANGSDDSWYHNSEILDLQVCLSALESVLVVLGFAESALGFADYFTFKNHNFTSESWNFTSKNRNFTSKNLNFTSENELWT